MSDWRNAGQSSDGRMMTRGMELIFAYTLATVVISVSFGSLDPFPLHTFPRIGVAVYFHAAFIHHATVTGVTQRTGADLSAYISLATHQASLRARLLVGQLPEGVELIR